MNAFLRITLFSLTIFTMASCERGCKKNELPPKEDLKPRSNKESLEKPEQIATFDTLNFDNLNAEQRRSLITFFNEEICPCGCPKTFAQCLLMKKGCKASQLLAQWTIDHIKKGLPEQSLFKAISEEINNGYLAPKKDINTNGAYHKGNPNAPITIVEFADFECPACKMAAMQLKEFLKENKEVQVYFMHFPLTAHPNAERAAVAAEAAGRLGKFWEMHDLLFGYNGTLTDSAIDELAQKIFTQKELKQYLKDKTDPALLKKVKEQKEYAQNELNLLGTPTFMFNGRPYNFLPIKEGFQLRLSLEKLRSEINCNEGN